MTEKNIQLEVKWEEKCIRTMWRQSIVMRPRFRVRGLGNLVEPSFLCLTVCRYLPTKFLEDPIADSPEKQMGTMTIDRPIERDVGMTEITTEKLETKSSRIKISTLIFASA